MTVTRDTAMARKRSWNEKLADSEGPPKVVKIAGEMSERWGTGTVVILAPMEIAEAMRKVRKGKLTTINEIRQALAKLRLGWPFRCQATAGNRLPVGPTALAHVAADSRSSSGAT